MTETDTRTDTPTEADRERPPALVGRVSRLEWTVATVAGAVMAGLVIIEPDILGAPFENTRSLVFTAGGTAIAALALVAMLWFRVPPLVRIAVLAVPFVAVTWWLISPFFVDEVVNEDFVTSIADATGIDEPDPDETDQTTPPADPAEAVAPTTTEPTAPAGPTLVGSGQFVGLAGHSGTGDAGFFTDGDGSSVLRLENLDIQNGPDLQLYVVPGADRTAPEHGSVHLGALRGNVGNQTYELPADLTLTPGDWTVLVWCEAFAVEFVGATVTVT